MPIFRRENGIIEAVAGNSAILDENGMLPTEIIPLLPADVIPFIPIEEFQTHAGTIPEFMESDVGGAGVVTEQPTTHDIRISTGINQQSHALVQSKKTWSLDGDWLTGSWVVNDMINNYSISACQTIVGFRNDFSSIFVTNGCFFRCWGQSNNFKWYIVTSNTVTASLTQISTINSSDLLTIRAKSDLVEFYVNSVLVGSKTIYIPTASLHAGAAVVSDHIHVSAAREIDLDMMNIHKI